MTMEQESVEPSRAQPAPEDPIAEPLRYDQQTSPVDQPGEHPQPSAPVAGLPQSPWQPTPAVADGPPSPWQPNGEQPVGQPEVGYPQQQPLEQQSPWQPAAPASYAPPQGWQPNWQQPSDQSTIAMQAGAAVPVANLPQSPWQPDGRQPAGQAAIPQPQWGAPGQQPLMQQTWPAPSEPWHPPLVVTADLPPNWHAPLRTDLVPIVPRKRRSKKVILIAAAMVVLLIAGVTTWLAWPPDRSPFEQAVANLAAQPVANYTAELPDGSQFDGRVTTMGDAVGWLTADKATGIKFQFLLANGTMYLKLNGTYFPPGALQDAYNQTGLKDRWITGDVGELKELAKQNATPAAIAGKLRDEVARTEKLPEPSDDGTTINGVAVLKGDTPDGTLYVAKEQPYRVVRWIDKSTKKAAVAFTNPGNLLRLNGERASYTGLGTADFKPVTANDVDQTYDEMETDVSQLGNAINTSVQYTVNAVDNLEHFDDCEAAGCQVVAHFTTTTSPRTSPPAQTNVEMTASVTIDDVPAGSCTTTDKVATTGAVTMSCMDKDIHGGFTQANEAAKAKARAESGGSGYYAWFVYVRAKVHALALASVDTLAEGKRLESFRPDRACGWAEKGGSGKVPVNLYDKFSARLDTARYPDFEIHVFQDGQPYGDFGPSGWFAKNGGVAVPSDPPAKLQQQLKDAAVAFMKSAGTLKDGDSTDGDKWKRPATKC
ncbi:hypothetical protein [Kutzneria chonburiensis]|uniref:Uncharacterized protein n=1 Tax=Kutzneria chonburiensis TaxID=1483604 RepID=A0ABV6MPP6_9PSEU|nr:hypothetical protein [Kutzneria chonburiensis]